MNTQTVGLVDFQRLRAKQSSSSSPRINRMNESAKSKHKHRDNFRLKIESTSEEYFYINCSQKALCVHVLAVRGEAAELQTLPPACFAAASPTQALALKCVPTFIFGSTEIKPKSTFAQVFPSYLFRLTKVFTLIFGFFSGTYWNFMCKRRRGNIF